MPQFQYRRLLDMPPRPGRRYHTTYIKQRRDQHQALLTWLIQIADQCATLCDLDPELAQWFAEPRPEFPTSEPGRWYSPEDILTDMIDQMSQGRDLAQAQLGRWNRLCAQTPWHIELVEATDAKTHAPPGSHDEAE